MRKESTNCHSKALDILNTNGCCCTQQTHLYTASSLQSQTPLGNCVQVRSQSYVTRGGRSRRGGVLACVCWQGLCPLVYKNRRLSRFGRFFGENAFWKKKLCSRLKEPNFLCCCRKRCRPPPAGELHSGLERLRFGHRLPDPAGLH